MKARKVFPLTLLVVLSVIPLAGWAQETYTPTADEELYGIWTTRSGEQTQAHPQKSIISAEGRKYFVSMSDTSPCIEETFVIESRRIDEQEGAVYYRVFVTETRGWYRDQGFQYLFRISDSGGVCESVFKYIGKGTFDPTRFPQKVGAGDPTYDVVYRVPEE